MAGVTWILTFLCVAGRQLSPASPVPRSARVVRAGQNVTLTCNLTSSAEVTWYRLRSDQPLPLLTVRLSKIGGQTVVYHSVDSGCFSSMGEVEQGPLSLEIQKVTEEDGGLYFCMGSCPDVICVSRGILLAVEGVDGQSARDRTGQPCWNPEICALPALLALVSVLVLGLYLCSGRPAVCCGGLARGGVSLRITEDESLHYSSLRHAARPRPSGPGRRGLVKEDVTYSVVASGKSRTGHMTTREEAPCRV